MGSYRDFIKPLPNAHACHRSHEHIVSRPIPSETKVVRWQAILCVMGALTAVHQYWV